MIRIAVISSIEFISRITKFESKFPNIKLFPYFYDNPLEASEIVEKIHHCDAFLFAGPLPYYIAKEKVLEKKLPAVYIPSDEYTLAQTLLYLMVNEPSMLSKISIDIHKEESIQHVTSELNLTLEDWYIKDLSEVISEDYINFDIEEIVSFHQNLWEQNKAQFAITNIDLVYKRLQLLGIPCTFLIVPDKAIIDSIHQLITYSQLALSKSAEISIGLVVFNNKEELGQDLERIKFDTSILLQQSLFDLVKETENAIRLIGTDQFIIYGTRGSIEQLLSVERLNAFYSKINYFTNVTVSMGFGFGSTAKEAEENGRIALYSAQKNSNLNQVFLTTAEKKVIGPLLAETKSHNLKSKDKRILELAENSNLSIATITKLLQFSDLRKNKGFTSIELAEYFEISRRSAERLIKKFNHFNFIEKVGEEQPYQQGRPRAVYQVELNI